MAKLKVWLVRNPLFAPIVALGVVVSSNIAYAQSGTVTTQNGLGDLLCNVVSWMVYVLIIVCTIMIVWAAYLYVIGGDDTEKVTKARQTITWAAVGLGVALIAKGFPELVASLVGTSSITFIC
jgi:hypothetical protein